MESPADRLASAEAQRALTAVNLSMPLTNGIFALGLTFATGTSVLISVSMGKGRLDRACELFSQNILAMAVLGILVTVLVLLNLESVARFLGATSETLIYVREYAGVISVFAVFFMDSYNLEVLVKTDGFPQLSTIGVVSCAVMNVILDYVFVIRLHWGVKGAVFLFNHAILSSIGGFALVSYTVASYLSTLVLMTMTGISQGIQPLLAFYHGRGENRLCGVLLKYGLIFSCICGLAAFITGMAAAPGITGFFIGNERGQPIFNYTVRVLRLYSFAFLPVGFNVIAAGFFAAVERPAAAMSISIGRGVILIAACLLALPLFIGDNGIWLAAGASEILCLILTLILSGRYRKQTQRGNNSCALVSRPDLS